MHKALQSLNSKINPSKTESQHNDYAPSRVGECITVGSEGGKGIKVKCLEGNKPIGHLGAWTDCNKNTDYGPLPLREKTQQRLERLQHCKAHPATKVMLAKSKILSLWSHTAAVQDIDSDFMEQWDSKLYELITRYGFAYVICMLVVLGRVHF